MKYSEQIKMAFRSILSNKMRSFLTVLGIIIGIASVVAILSVGKGVTNNVSGTFNDLGNTSISISVDKKADNSEKITLSDLEDLKESVSSIKYISPNNSMAVTGVSSSKENDVILISGTPDVQYTSGVMNKQIISGRYFNQEEFNNAENVVVISEETAAYFFPNKKNIIGETITLKNTQGNVSAKVIGVTKGSNTNLLGNNDDDNVPKYVSMPITATNYFQKGINLFSDITVIVHNQDEIKKASLQIVNFLMAQHDVENKDIYIAKNYLQMFEQINGVLDLFIQFIASVAGIALIVGGIGVMNIMLVSVTERTKEIGIRKALGATDKDIKKQFLIESLILCLMGGIVGVILGALLTKLFSIALSVNSHIDIITVISVLIFSSVIGLFFGVYPAKKASQLNPIDALRYE